MLTGRANFGPWFLSGQVTFAGTPKRQLQRCASCDANVQYDSNRQFGATSTASTATPAIRCGTRTAEELYGVFPGFAGTFSLLSDHWRADEGGDKAFAIGMEPFDLNVTVASLYDNLRAGAVNGNGGGVPANGTLSFALGPVIGNFYA
jgi:hypothetical protein